MVTYIHRTYSSTKQVGLEAHGVFEHIASVPAIHTVGLVTGADAKDDARMVLLIRLGRIARLQLN